MSEPRFWKVWIQGLNDHPQDPGCYVKAATGNKARYKAVREAKCIGYRVYYVNSRARVSEPPPPGHHFYEAR